MIGLPDCSGADGAVGTIADIFGASSPELPCRSSTRSQHRRLRAAGIPVPENYSAPGYTGTGGGHRRPPAGDPRRRDLPADLLLRAVVGPEPKHQDAHRQGRRRRDPAGTSATTGERSATRTARAEPTSRTAAARGEWTCPNPATPRRRCPPTQRPRGTSGCGRRSTTRRTAGTTAANAPLGRVRAGRPAPDQGQLHPGRRRHSAGARLRPDRPDLDGQRLQRLHRQLPRVPARRPLPQGADRLGPALERLHGDAGW